MSSRIMSASAACTDRLKGDFTMKNLNETVFANVIKNYITFGGLR